jgi:PAS domain S-box-containing protein
MGTLKHLRVLFVAEADADTEQLAQELGRNGYALFTERVATAADLAAACDRQSWDLILSGCVMEHLTVTDALAVVKGKKLDIPFIVVSETLEEGLAVAAMKAGAHDFLLKGNLSRLVPAVERELRDAAERNNRRRMQTAIRRGKMEWEAAFDAGSDLIILTDLTGRVIRCNGRVIAYFNCEYRDVLGRQVAELFYGAQPDDQRIFRLSQQAPDPVAGEDIRFPMLAGWFNVTSYPMQFEGKPYGMVHIVKDITTRRHAEEERKASERELLTLYAIAFRLNSTRGHRRVMTDLLAQLHAMLGIDFSAIHLCTKGGLRLKTSLGLSREFAAAIRTLPVDAPWMEPVLIGRHYRAGTLADELPPQVTTAARAMGMRAWCAVPLMLGDEIIGVLMVAHRAEQQYADREIFLLKSIANQLAVLIENHTLYGRMQEKTRELQRSRQELKENLLEVRRANIELGRLNAAKNSFIGLASHELKTPITSILGGVDFLYNYSGLALTEEQRRIFASVYEGMLQLKGLVADLLSFSRLETGGSLQKRPLNLVVLAREVRESFALPLSTRQIQLTFAGEGMPVPADEGYCRLVLRNILENAIKFTPDGGTIRVSGRLITRKEVCGWEREISPFYPAFIRQLPGSATFYRLDVSDTGIGIPSDERLRVFEKFYGVGDLDHHTSGKTDFMARGSGLGLAIVRGIMDGHDGLVWNTGNPDGAGTVFSLLFPMED